MPTVSDLVIIFSRTLAWVIFVAFSAIGEAQAHPHVFVTAKCELIYADGALKAIQYAWTFDEMFSTFSIQGLDKNGDGKLSRDELSDLTKETIESLKELNFFTKGKIDGKQIVFSEPSDFWFDADDKNVLTLHFTLPVKGVIAKGTLSIDVYDPEYYIAISFADDKPVLLFGAPRGCAVKVIVPKEDTSSPSESFFSQLKAGVDYGAQFANHVTVDCQ